LDISVFELGFFHLVFLGDWALRLLLGFVNHPFFDFLWGLDATDSDIAHQPAVFDEDFGYWALVVGLLGVYCSQNA
jgi:hypothetical protein